MGAATLDPLVGIDASRPLRLKLISVPELQTKYMGYVRDIGTKWLDWNTLGPIVERYRQLIEADVQVDTKRLETYEAFVQATIGNANSLKTFAAERRQFLLKP